MCTLASRPRTVADVPSPPKAPFVIFPFQEVTTTHSRRRLSFHSANPIPSARSESLPSPYLSGSVSSLSASTTTLRALSSSRTQRTQSASRRSTPGDSPTNGTGRCLPTPNANTSSTSLSATVSRSPRVLVPDPPPRFCAIPHLPNVQNVEPAPPPVMHWNNAPVWGALPTHGFRALAWVIRDRVSSSLT